MQKRRVTLSVPEVETLEQGHQHHRSYQFRNRCQCLLLSAQGHEVAALGALFSVSRFTIYSWFERWETAGLAGLPNAKGQGRPCVLQAQDAAQVRIRVGENRQQLKEVTTPLKHDLQKDFSPLTLKRFLKSLGGSGGVSATS